MARLFRLLGDGERRKGRRPTWLDWVAGAGRQGTLVGQTVVLVRYCEYCNALKCVLFFACVERGMCVRLSAGWQLGLGLLGCAPVLEWRGLTQARAVCCACLPCLAHTTRRATGIDPNGTQPPFNCSHRPDQLAAGRMPSSLASSKQINSRLVCLATDPQHFNSSLHLLSHFLVLGLGC